MHTLLVAALHWDPQIRGALIVITAFAILPGSVFLLLSTNVGARLGVLLATTGLFGWLTVLAATWVVFGIGDKGAEPSWKAKEIITGPLAVATTPVMRAFPNGWRQLKEGDSKLADATAASDRVLSSVAANAPPKPGEEPKPPKILEQFPSPFKQTTEYVFFAGYTKGGDNEVFTIGRHKFFFGHSPHYTVIQVKAAIPQPEGTVGKPLIDDRAATVSVLQVRDLGNVRWPSTIIMVMSALIFGICCRVLHRRDKEIMRLRAQAATA